MSMSRLRTHIRETAPQEQAPRVQGCWFNIRLLPDLATGEVLNVGVGFIEAGGEIHTLLLEDVARLKCLYGAGLAEELGFLSGTVRTALRSGSLRPPSWNVVYSEPKHAADHSVEGILAQLFEQTVSLAQPIRDPDEADAFQSLDTQRARQLVFDQVRERAGLAAERIIAESPVLEARDGERVHYLDVPLQGRDRLGTLVSAFYKDPTTVERHLMRAHVDLETASRLFAKDRLGLFVLRAGPDSRLTLTARSRMDNTLDELLWKVRQRQIHIEVEESTERLAQEVLNWAEARLIT